jgi:hypothetical protein
MPRRVFKPIHHDLDPDFAVVMNRVKKLVALAADKTIANSKESTRY